MACANYLCPGDFTVYINTDAADILVATPNLTDGANYVRIPEVLSWTLEPSTEEPNAFRTADTAGTRVKPCPGSTSWTATVNTKICLGSWLYDLLLDPAEKQPPTTGWYMGSEPIPKAWFYLSFDGDGPTSTPAVTDPGIFILGSVTPPGIGGDNDTDEAAGSEFTIEVSSGPFIPNL